MTESYSTVLRSVAVGFLTIVTKFFCVFVPPIAYSIYLSEKYLIFFIFALV